MAPEASTANSVDNIPQTNSQTGLTTQEAQKLLQQYGYNEIPEKSETTFQRVAKRLWGPIPWMIEIAAILSAVVRKWDDLIIILVLLIVNVVVDFLQESKALNALKALKEKLAKVAIVLRDGQYQQIPARELVPGDIIKLKIGDVIPADVRLLQGKYLQVDQSALTGESLPVDKQAGDDVYGNSIVKMGEMVAVVTATAMNTFFGKSAALVIQATKTGRSHFQKAVIKIGNSLIILTAFLAIFLLIFSLYRQDPMMEVFRFVLVLCVASIPVALPAVLSVTMAVGAMNLAKRQAIVSRLAAIEELAGVDVLCSDKTGTLTQNKMSLSEPILFNNYSEDDLLTYAVLASSKENNDPIEAPIFDYIDKHNLQSKVAAYKQTAFTPFDPISKRTVAEIDGNGGHFTVVKGAPQVVLKLCVNEKSKDQIAAAVQDQASKGYRSLGVAVKKGEDYSFVGLLSLYDPPREDSAETIKNAEAMGLKVKMITGDNQAIAKEIARILNIGDNILNTQELRDEDASREMEILAEVIGGALYKNLHPDADKVAIDKFKDEIVDEVKNNLKANALKQGHIKRHESEIVKVIEDSDGFSQVLPEDKFFIIDALQKADHIVAMTGDGVNDAPALKKADAGIAVSGATDAAKAAADLILLAPGLSVIIHALREARMVFERMKNYAIFRIAETTRVILFMSLSILVFNFYPVTAVMIVILALLNDIPIMMIAYDNVAPSPVPVRWNMRETLIVSGVLGLAGVISSFLLYYYLERNGFSQAIIQTIIFVKLDVAGHSTIYVTRTGEKHFWKRPFPSLKFFVPAFSTRIIGTLVAAFGLFMAPISWKYIGYIWLYATIWFVVNDFIKVGVFKLIRRNNP